ncbi:MAG: single-stranded DNA-binding protein [Saprospiraceae bacterium]
MINKVILVGNLGKDPEVRHLESGSVMARFSVATNENYQDKNGEWQTQTEWHNIVCWRSLAERAERSLKKGSLIYLEGKLTTRKWQDKDGNDKYTTEVVARTIRALERREPTISVEEGASTESLSGDQNTFETIEKTIDPAAAPEKDDVLPF